EGQPTTIARFESVDTAIPRTQLLGNSGYSVMVTSAGGGYTRWRDIDITRWRSDPTLDNWGSFIYLQDVEGRTTWSTSYHPVGRAASRYAATFNSDRVTFERRDVGIETTTEIVVSPEDDADIRRITLVNRSGRRRQIQVTSYVELALAPHSADRTHLTFSKMFVQTEASTRHRALFACRKPRLPTDPPVFAAHVLVLPADRNGTWEYETNRARFLGRGRDMANPAALDGSLSNSAGSPLDPIFSLRGQVTLEPGTRVQLAFVTIAGESRERVEALVEKYHDLREVERASELSGYQAQLEPRHLRVTAEEIQRFQQLASNMLYPNARLRAAEARLRQNRLGQSRLWAYGISGDLPIMVVTVGDRLDAELVREALVAHTFWRLRGFKCDLVILNEEVGGYEQTLQNYLKTLVQAHAQYTGLEQPGGIFLRPADHVPADDLTLILTVAQVVLVASRGSLIQQLSAPLEPARLPAPLGVAPRSVDDASPPLPFLVLPYFNGVGGFTEDGKEYAIYLGPGVQTPAPWINVIANPSFGALVSETGQGYAWSENSQSNRLLPWS
ncbi:MAG TPA: protein ndvB, partial [Chloroflexota bacterium]|nr:protein ndvB [Chloroflexota bacterium]